MKWKFFIYSFQARRRHSKFLTPGEEECDSLGRRMLGRRVGEKADHSKPIICRSLNRFVPQFFLFSLGVPIQNFTPTVDSSLSSKTYKWKDRLYDKCIFQCTTRRGGENFHWIRIHWLNLSGALEGFFLKCLGLICIAVCHGVSKWVVCRDLPN